MTPASGKGTCSTGNLPWKCRELIEYMLEAVKTPCKQTNKGYKQGHIIALYCFQVVLTVKEPLLILTCKGSILEYTMWLL